MSGGAKETVSDSSAEDSDLSGARGLKLWRQSSSNADELDLPDASLILLISGSGTVENIISQNDHERFLPNGIARGQNIADVWPENINEQIRRNTRKSLQSRKAYSKLMSDEESALDIEMIFAPQGRDRVMLIVRDVSASIARAEKLADLAFMDTDTGLPNREWLATELDTIVQRISLRQGRGAVIYFDIGKHDNIQVSHGENACRAVLDTTASRLTQSLRGANQSDETDDERYSAVARVGDSQFAVVLPDIDTGDDAAGVAARLANLLESPLSIGDREYSISVSVGIALYPQDGANADDLLESARVTLQEARFTQTSSHKFHSGTVKMRALERQDLIVEMENALRNDEFELNFLPILKPDERRVSTVEVLLRWPRPLFASRPIQEVIKAAEYTGLIIPIGEWVLTSACRQLTNWNRNGSTDLRLAVNVSGQEFARDDYVDRVSRILDEVDVDPERIDLEITEHLLFRDAMRGFNVSKGLANIGVRVVVDDYGTGICSFDYLSGSPIKGVKIHQKFTARVDEDAASRAACAAITAMAHELGMEVTAEGVETEEQATFLSQIGCDNLQGFVYCEPQTCEEMTAFLGRSGTTGGDRD